METISRSLLTFLVNSLWQIPLTAAVAALACRLMRNGPASHRNAVWVAALAAAILLPLASVHTSGPTATPQIAVSLPAGDAATATSALQSHTHAPGALSPAAASRRTVSFAETTAAVLLGIYFLFVVFRLARLAWASIHTVQIRRAARESAVPGLLKRVWIRCQEAYGLTGVELLFSPGVSGPVTAGQTIHPSAIPARRAIGRRAHYRPRTRNGAYRTSRLRLQHPL